MAKSKHRLGKGKKSKRSPQKGENAKLSSKKSETTKPRNKAVMALLSTAVLIKSTALKIFAAFKAMAKGAKEKVRKISVPVKVAVIAVKAKCIKAVSTVKAIAASVNAKRLKAVEWLQAVSASVKTKWLPIAGVKFWNYIIAPVLAVVIVMRARPRYMAAALLLIAIPTLVITIAVYSLNAESSGAVPAILAADNADENEASDATMPAEVNAAIQGEALDVENETPFACIAVVIILTAVVLWVVIPRKSDPLVPLEDVKSTRYASGDGKRDKKASE